MAVLPSGDNDVKNWLRGAAQDGHAGGRPAGRARRRRSRRHWMLSVDSYFADEAEKMIVDNPTRQL